MSNFENLQKEKTMVFLEEESSEKVKEEILRKEQNSLNDFITTLDKKVYNNLNNFPIKLPMKLDYPDSIKLDDFILLSVKDEFYLFPKMFKRELSNYLYLEEYFKINNITPSNIFRLNIDQRRELNNIYGVVLMVITCIIALLMFFLGITRILLDSFIVVAPFPICGAIFFFLTVINENKIEYFQNEEDRNELLPKLRTLKFPLEFFDNKNIDKIKIY